MLQIALTNRLTKAFSLLLGVRDPARSGVFAGENARSRRTILLRTLPATALAALALLAHAASAQRPIDLGFSYSQEQTKFVGSSSSDFFRLRGATIDLGYTLHRSFGVVVAADGLSVTNLRQSIDIHEASFLAGPRFTYNYGHITPTAWNRHLGMFADAKIGYTIATSGLYPISNTTLTNHASALTWTFGGGLNLHFYHRLDLRLPEIDYVQTHLPNGGSNQQNNLRVSAGVNFHFGN
jgi:hypothetical protein